MLVTFNREIAWTEKSRRGKPGTLTALSGIGVNPKNETRKLGTRLV